MVPMAERKNEKTMMYRVKEVIMTRIEGSNAINVVRARICNVWT
jgi:hypothetical protein